LITGSKNSDEHSPPVIKIHVGINLKFILLFPIVTDIGVCRQIFIINLKCNVSQKFVYWASSFSMRVDGADGYDETGIRFLQLFEAYQNAKLKKNM
jgi:hypothetical protein